MDCPVYCYNAALSLSLDMDGLCAQRNKQKEKQFFGVLMLQKIFGFNSTGLVLTLMLIRFYWLLGKGLLQENRMQK